jgi:hypothetical protein
MAMIYYRLSQKEERGCPLGDLRVVLYDRYYARKEAECVELGGFPWYAEIHSKDARICLPKGMVAITKERLWDFDIRARGFFLVSDEFMGMLKEFSVPMESFAPITVCSQDGKSVSKKNYNAVIFPKVDIFDVMDQEKSQVGIDKELGWVRSIKKLVLRSDFSQHLFVPMLRLYSGYHTPICSAPFYKAALDLNIKGVNFTPLNDDSHWTTLYGIS